MEFDRLAHYDFSLPALFVPLEDKVKKRLDFAYCVTGGHLKY